jgi:hypothetical protein
MSGLEITTGKIRYRVKNPNFFKEGSFRTKSIAEEGIQIIIGKIKSGSSDSMITQAYIFDRKTWDKERVKKWIQSNIKKEWKIENINKEDIEFVDNDSLYSLRNRLKQVHILDFYTKAEIVLNEMDNRKLPRYNSLVDSIVKEKIEKREEKDKFEKIEQPSMPLTEWLDYENDYMIVLYVDGQREQKINERCEWISIADLQGAYFLYSRKVSRFVGMVFYKDYGWTVQNGKSALKELLGQKYYSNVGLDGKPRESDVHKEEFEKELEQGNILVSFYKVEDEERIVTGIVYLPDEVDSHGDFMKASTIRKMMINWVTKYQKFKLQHNEDVSSDKVQMVECFQAPITYASGTTIISKGAWLLSSKINDEQIWKDVKEGKITGYSIGGWGKRVEM